MVDFSYRSRSRNLMGYIVETPSMVPPSFHSILNLIIFDKVVCEFWISDEYETYILLVVLELKWINETSLNLILSLWQLLIKQYTNHCFSICGKLLVKDLQLCWVLSVVYCMFTVYFPLKVIQVEQKMLSQFIPEV